MSEHKQNSDDRPLHLEAGGIVIDKPKSEEQIARETREREDHEFKRDQVKTNRHGKNLDFFTHFAAAVFANITFTTFTRA